MFVKQKICYQCPQRELKILFRAKHLPRNCSKLSVDQGCVSDFENQILIVILALREIKKVISLFSEKRQ